MCVVRASMCVSGGATVIKTLKNNLCATSFCFLFYFCIFFLTYILGGYDFSCGTLSYQSVPSNVHFMTDGIRMQMEVQRRLHEQLEVSN